LTEYVINIVDNYEVPEAPLTSQQYVVFVMNRAAESYKHQYNTADFETGIAAARDAYNESQEEVTP